MDAGFGTDAMMILNIDGGVLKFVRKHPITRTRRTVTR